MLLYKTLYFSKFDLSKICINIIITYFYISWAILLCYIYIYTYIYIYIYVCMYAKYHYPQYISRYYPDIFSGYTLPKYMAQIQSVIQFYLVFLCYMFLHLR
jgi:hypothetical protein